MGTVLTILDPTMIRFIYSAILVMLNGYLVFSQNIEGVVVDSITQEPIPYVHIYSEEFQIATISNEEGKFIFKRNEKNLEISFSHVSYKTRKIISRDSESLLRVSLLSNETTLSEVVITDAGYKIAKKVFDKLRNNHSVQFGNAFYRQTTRSGDKPIEFIETFSHISSSLTGIEKFDMYQSRFAKLKSEPDDPYLSFNNFSYLTFGFKILSPR